MDNKNNPIAQKLLQWYDENKRDLPWRHSTNPYSIWVSEIMAQQTRITALIPYYHRFMKQFPTLWDLADATEDEILKAWEGLGYYSRARNLRLAAQKVVSHFNGKIPNTKKDLMGLPGIGEYTAGAILSIAFDIPTPAVDGNVLRVFSRLENNDVDVMTTQAKVIAQEFVTGIMPDERISCFTQALMELGAIICLPKNPLCGTCPVYTLCKAFQCNRQGELPRRSPKKPPANMDKTILILCNTKGQILMRQRTEKLLNGLWEFYMTDGFMSPHEIKNHLLEMGYTIANLIPLGQAKHVFTHIIWNMEGFYCAINETHLPEGYIFCDKGDIQSLAVPTAIRFYADSIQLKK